MTLQDACDALKSGQKFGSVFSRLSNPNDGDILREYFVRNDCSGKLPNDGKMSPKDMGYTGDICPVCHSGRMVRVGTCKRCEDCLTSSGCD